MPLLLRRLAVAAPLRRSLCTAASRPPWAMVNIAAALDASAAPSPRARAFIDLNSTPCVSHLSVPARLVDPHGDSMESLMGVLRGASCDGLLLLDFVDTRHRPRWVQELARGGGVEPDAKFFVCNPLSGQLFRLPAPGGMDAARTTTPFGLLTQSGAPHGPPDRYAVAQLSHRNLGEGVVRRFLSETGEWDERPLVGPFTTDPERRMLINHEVLALGDRLWWVDVAWGACSVDPFSDRPEHRFVELPHSSLLHTSDLPMLARYRRMGVSDGKLRFVIVRNRQASCVIASYSLADETYNWTLDYGLEIEEHHLPFPIEVAAIDPFKANLVYLQHGAIVIAMDMSKGEGIWGGYLPEEIIYQMMRHPHSSLHVPCVLPTWLATSHIPSSGTLSSNKANCKMKTLADMLVRVDKCKTY